LTQQIIIEVKNFGATLLETILCSKAFKELCFISTLKTVAQQMACKTAATCNYLLVFQESATH